MHEDSKAPSGPDRYVDARYAWFRNSTEHACARPKRRCDHDDRECNAEVARQAMQYGACDFLAKPLDLHHLEHAIRPDLAGTPEGR